MHLKIIKYFIILIIFFDLLAIQSIIGFSNDFPFSISFPQGKEISELVSIPVIFDNLHNSNALF